MKLYSTVELQALWGNISYVAVLKKAAKLGLKKRRVEKSGGGYINVYEMENGELKIENAIKGSNPTHRLEKEWVPACAGMTHPSTASEKSVDSRLRGNDIDRVGDDGKAEWVPDQVEDDKKAEWVPDQVGDDIELPTRENTRSSSYNGSAGAETKAVPVILEEEKEVSNPTHRPEGEGLRPSTASEKSVDSLLRGNDIVGVGNGETGYRPSPVRQDSRQHGNDIRKYETGEIIKLSEVKREKQEEAVARYGIVQEWEAEKARLKQAGGRISEGLAEFIRALERGERCSAEVRLLGSVSEKSIYRWRALYRQGGLDALAENKRGRSNRINGTELYTWLKIEAADPRRHSATELYRALVVEQPEAAISLRTVQRIFNQVRLDRFLIAAAGGKESYKNGARPHIKRYNDLKPMQIAEGDGKMLNLLVQSPFKFHQNERFRELVRPWIVLWYDVATGYICGYALWIAESWHLVRTAAVDMFSKVGIPEAIRTDGGSSFWNTYSVPEWFASLKKETEAVKRARSFLAGGGKGWYKAMGIEAAQKTEAGNPESKQIEPAWGHIFRQWEKQQYAYVGENFAARPEWLNMTNKRLLATAGDKIMNWGELLEAVKQVVEGWNKSPRECLRSVEGKALSPAEVMGEAIVNKPMRELVEHYCWHPRKLTVGRDGINLDGLIYRHPTNFVYLNQQLLVEYDERHPSIAQLATLMGEKLEPASVLTEAGSNINQEITSRVIKENKHFGKVCQAVYLQWANTTDKSISNLNRICRSVDLVLEEQKRLQVGIKEGGTGSRTLIGSRMTEKRNGSRTKSGTTEVSNPTHHPEGEGLRPSTALEKSVDSRLRGNDKFWVGYDIDGVGDDENKDWVPDQVGNDETGYRSPIGSRTGSSPVRKDGFEGLEEIIENYDYAALSAETEPEKDETDLIIEECDQELHKYGLRRVIK